MSKTIPINKSTDKAEISREEALECVRKLILYIGDDPEREGLVDTPRRVIDSYSELFSGYGRNPKDILRTRFKVDNQEMVILNNIEFHSMCEHHILPFKGVCHIGYLPNDEVLGVSKLARLVELYCRRLQIQEELTGQIAETLMSILKPRGTAVIIEAQHMCMTYRGVSKQGTLMITSSFLGEFSSNSSYKSEFIDQCSRLSR